MGSSKKKKQKAKDFVKPKLKVGKGPVKSTTHTDLSFKAKSIVLPEQSLSNESLESLFEHQLSFLKHHSSQVRKNALGFMLTHVDQFQSSSKILNNISPLILDSSKTVRASTLKLLEKFDYRAITPYVINILLYIHSAMTHISPEIRLDSTKFLDYLLLVAPDQIVSMKWTKTLDSFFALFGWEINGKSSVFKINNQSIQKPQLQSFLKFLKAGIENHKNDTSSKQDFLYHRDTHCYLIPEKSNPFLSLSLFETVLVESADDVLTRRKILHPYMQTISSYMDSGQKEGGDYGRICKSITNSLSHC